MNKQEIKLSKTNLYTRTYSGKQIVKCEIANDIVQETYIECDGKNVWIVTYLNYKESNRNLVATL